MTKRLAVLGALTCLVLSSLAITAPAANAAWRNVMQIHGAKLQLCKVPLADGRTRIKARLDNRGGDHTHLGGVSAASDSDQPGRIEFRTGAGRLSPVKSMVFRRGERFLSAGMGETTGEGAGGDAAIRDLPRC